MILRACAVCGALSDRERCPAHRPKDDRPTASARGYGAAWQRRRAAWLAEHPVCVDCGAAATDVDHIVPKRQGGADDGSNYASRCHSCHSRKTASSDGGFGR